MTSWKRASIKQHKDLRTPAYKQRVVPLVRNEKREKAMEQIEKQELEEVCTKTLIHEVTEKCGFDRTSSHNENTYVCTCGWHGESNDT